MNSSKINKYRFSKSLFCLMVALQLTACGGVKESSYFPEKNILSKSNVKESDLKWMQFLGVSRLQEDNSLSLSTWNNNLISADSKGSLKVMSPVTGNFIKKIKVAKQIISGPGVRNNYAAVVSDDLELILVNVSNEKVIWKKKLEHEVIAKPLITTDSIIVHNTSGEVTSYSINSGIINWGVTYIMPSIVASKFSSPVYHRGSIIVGLSNGKLISINDKNGDINWEYSLNIDLNDDISVDNLNDICVTPVVHRGTVYAAGCNNDLIALDVSSGNLKWQKKISSYSGMMVSNDKLLIVGTLGNLYALNPYTGSQYWQQKFLIGRKLSEPAIYKDKMVVSDPTGYLHIIGVETGKVLTHMSMYSNGTTSYPVVLNNNLYVQAHNGCLLSLNMIEKPAIK